MSEKRARFLDTNVILRHLTRDDEEKARQALALFARYSKLSMWLIARPTSQHK